MLNRLDIAEGEFLRAIVDVAGDALMVIDSAGTMIYSSTGLDRFAGVPANDLIGRESASLFHPDDQRIVIAEV